MRITVALTPSLLRQPLGHVVAVVDVLRATTTLGTLLEQGAVRAIISDNIQQARKLAITNFSLLCGEVKSKQPAGFDYGNSPSELATAALKGRSAVLFTTNGTRAVVKAAEAPVVLAASLRNRRAAAARLLGEAGTRGLDIAVVCAGNERGAAFSLEDTAAAGAVVEAIVEADGTVAMTDGSWAAYHLWRWYQGDALAMFRQAAHARALHELGFADDLRYCAELDASATVPALADGRGMLVMRA